MVLIFPNLHFTFDGHFSPQLKQTLLKIWKNLPRNVTSCMDQDLYFLEAALDPNTVHPTGPCQSFFQLLDDFAPPLASHVFLLEPNVIPIQSFWLDQLQRKVNENVNCSRFWMTGSISRCRRFYGDLALRKDSHINGNSLYCLQDPRFQHYREAVKKFYPPAGPAKIRGCATGLGYENGFDHTMYQFLNEMRNFEIRQEWIHKFVYTTFIQNRCEDTYNATQLLLQDPDTFLVHGKFFFFTQKKKELLWKLFNFFFLEILIQKNF